MLRKTDRIRTEEEERAKRTDALFSVRPDAFHMTEREQESDGKTGRERGLL